MLELPIKEIIIFVSVGTLYLAAAIVGIVQLFSGGEKYRRLVLPVVSLAVCLEAVLLIFRAVAIKAVPLTGLFESMIVLTIVFGLVFLFFSITIKQVWFGSVMVWVILIMILLAGVVAKPASEPRSIAATPWAIAHGIAMVLSGALIVFATANAFLYLLHAQTKAKESYEGSWQSTQYREVKKTEYIWIEGLFCVDDIRAGKWVWPGYGKINSYSNEHSRLADRRKNCAYYRFLDIISDCFDTAPHSCTQGQDDSIYHYRGLLSDSVCNYRDCGFL